MADISKSFTSISKTPGMAETASYVSVTKDASRQWLWRALIVVTCVALTATIVAAAAMARTRFSRSKKSAEYLRADLANLTSDFTNLTQQSGNRFDQVISDVTSNSALIESQKQQTGGLNVTLNRFLDVPSSCGAISGAASGLYTINPDPNSVLPFQVYCNFDVSPAETWVGHDSENEIEAGPAGETCEDPQCYRRDVIYTATDEQIRALVVISSGCRQFMRYRCQHSKLANYFAWITRSGYTRRNFAGSADNQACPCHVAGTCDHRCHCDENDNVWRWDDGYYTNKNELPVKAMFFGDLDHNTSDDNEEGWHTLGKLECW